MSLYYQPIQYTYYSIYYFLILHIFHICSDVLLGRSICIPQHLDSNYCPEDSLIFAETLIKMYDATN